MHFFIKVLFDSFVLSQFLLSELLALGLLFLPLHVDLLLETSFKLFLFASFVLLVDVVEFLLERPSLHEIFLVLFPGVSLGKGLLRQRSLFQSRGPEFLELVVFDVLDHGLFADQRSLLLSLILGRHQLRDFEGTSAHLLGVNFGIFVFLFGKRRRLLNDWALGLVRLFLGVHFPLRFFRVQILDWSVHFQSAFDGTSLLTIHYKGILD